MLKNLTLEQTPVAAIGEEIGLELGIAMVTSYKSSHPTDVIAYEVGRNIIDEILAQPGCAGLRFYNAYNEKGEKTLVYVGLDKFGKSITQIAIVAPDGSYRTETGIVADRIKVPIGREDAALAIDLDDFIWTID